MLFSYIWLQSFFKKKLPPPKKLAEILTIRSFETFCAKSAIDVDVLSNRISDCSSHLGIAREISAIIGLPFSDSIEMKKDFFRKNSKDIQKILKVEVQDKDLCYRYCAKVMTGIRVKPSPLWMQKRLLVCGLTPINNIVDAANYVMLETGQPLHAFDFEKLSSIKSWNKKNGNSKSLRSIIVRKAKKEEKIITLDGKKYIFDKNVLVIADKKEPLAVAGIKGGQKAEIDDNTKNIVLEAANFDRTSIYKTSKKLKLESDASLRFSHSIDPNLCQEAMNKVCGLIEKIAGGKEIKGIIDIYPKKVFPKKIKLDLTYVEKLLGVKIPESKIVKILKALQFKIFKSSASNNQSLIIEIPTFRKDMEIPEDLIEEIGRIYGYEHISPKMPLAFLSSFSSEENKELSRARKIKGLMKEFGFFELFLYSFISEKDSQVFISDLIEIKNPVSLNTKYLRPSLLPNLLKIVKDNQGKFVDICLDTKKKSLASLKFFEFGKIYYKNKEKNEKQSIIEKGMITGIITGKDKFLEIKGVVETLLEKLGIVDLFFDSFKVDLDVNKGIFWQKEQTAEIKIGDNKIGFLGKIRKEILDFYQVSDEVFAFEIDFEKLSKSVVEEHKYRKPSQYPESARDIAVLVPIRTLSGSIIQKIHLLGGKLIRDVEIFDVFEGASLPSNRKNLAFHIIFQARDKTLTSKEVDNIIQKIIQGLEDNIKWQVRK